MIEFAAFFLIGMIVGAAVGWLVGCFCQPVL